MSWFSRLVNVFRSNRLNHDLEDEISFHLDSRAAEWFIDHYLVPIVYPPGLTRELQTGLGIAVLLLNLALYALAWRRHRRNAI